MLLVGLLKYLVFPSVPSFGLFVFSSRVYDAISIIIYSEKALTRLPLPFPFHLSAPLLPGSI